MAACPVPRATLAARCRRARGHPFSTRSMAQATTPCARPRCRSWRCSAPARTRRASSLSTRPLSLAGTPSQVAPRSCLGIVLQVSRVRSPLLQPPARAVRVTEAAASALPPRCLSHLKGTPRRWAQVTPDAIKAPACPDAQICKMHRNTLDPRAESSCEPPQMERSMAAHSSRSGTSTGPQKRPTPQGGTAWRLFPAGSLGRF